MNHLSHNPPLRYAAESPASTHELQRAAAAKASDTRATEPEPAARVEISAAAQARADETGEKRAVEVPERTDVVTRGQRVSDPKFKQVLWSQELWLKHPSGEGPDTAEHEDTVGDGGPTEATAEESKLTAFSLLRFTQAYAQSGPARS